MGNYVEKYRREINNVILHCSGGHPEATAQSILNYWKRVKGWRHPGYHKLVLFKGQTHIYADPSRVTNGVLGHNSDAYHICWTGGYNGIDNRTSEQKEGLYREVKWAINEFGKDINIWGHRDFSKDLDGNGIISPFEWSKQCPSFDVIAWLNETGLYNTLLS